LPDIKIVSILEYLMFITVCQRKEARSPLDRFVQFEIHTADRARYPSHFELARNMTASVEILVDI